MDIIAICGFAAVLLVFVSNGYRFNTRIERRIKQRQKYLASIEAKLMDEYRREITNYHKEVHAWSDAARVIGGAR